MNKCPECGSEFEIQDGIIVIVNGISKVGCPHCGCLPGVKRVIT